MVCGLGDVGFAVLAGAAFASTPFRILTLSPSFGQDSIPVPRLPSTPVHFTRFLQ
jgi:hypothetical protein